LTAVKEIVCPCPDRGFAESRAPNDPVKVPAELGVPLNVPVDVSSPTVVHVFEKKLYTMGGTPPEVVTWNEKGLFTQAVGNVVGLVMTNGSAIS